MITDIKWFVTLTLVWVALSLSTAGYAQTYYAQIKASESASQIEREQARITSLNIPSTVSRTDVNGRELIRLRLGPYVTQEDAKTAVGFLGYSDVWIIPSDDEPAVTGVKQFEPQLSDLVRPTILVAEHEPVVFIHEIGVGVETAIRGSLLTVITPDYIDAVPNVTGMKQEVGLLSVGVLEKVYEDLTGESAVKFEPAIVDFLKKHGISRETFESGKKNIGRSVVFTLEGVFDLSAGEMKLSGDTGFDYWGPSGEVIHSGELTYANPLGNHCLTRVEDGWHSEQSPFATVITYAEPMGSTRLLVLFLQGKESQHDQHR